MLLQLDCIFTLDYWYEKYFYILKDKSTKWEKTRFISAVSSSSISDANMLLSLCLPCPIRFPADVLPFHVGFYAFLSLHVSNLSGFLLYSVGGVFLLI